MKTFWSAELDRIHKILLPKHILPYGPEDRRLITLALCGEAGELANLVKKEWTGRPPDGLELAIALELADIAMYLDISARAFNVDLERAIRHKLQELYKRWPETAPRPHP